jgi:hypothetical protein
VVRRAVSDRYGRFYAPLAVAVVGLAFLPLFEDVTVQTGYGSETTSYGTVFDMAGRSGGGPAVLGILLLATLVALLVTAAVRGRSALLPAAITLVASVIVLMLVTKPGTGRPTPHLSESGTAGMVLALCTCALGAVHAIHLSVLRAD